MKSIINLSYMDLKNFLKSIMFKVGLLIPIGFSLLLTCIIFKRNVIIDDFTPMLGQFLYITIIIFTAQILLKDILSNTDKQLFTGKFNRSEILLSKFFSILIIGVFLSLFIQIIAFLMNIIIYKKDGFYMFLNLEHIKIIFSYTLITLFVGSIMLLVVSIFYKKTKPILLVGMSLFMINYFNPFIITSCKELIISNNVLYLYSKTPFFKCSNLILGDYNYIYFIILLISSLIFNILNIIIINNKEI
ncbi:hypothetical protein GCM10008904_09930 [Paraclostridium ghonii]|uniref:ABC-type transport system involved in multi-copper enzyme maturation permease subunit n=1 Tax=Paraclostridium ghonii TaxID=29358 RepID=A0ABU0MYH9_9FIRM|nr:hypothetical protein [Paeniclostridium ghonii]MDQ0555978.1 ABC-type transport system involved in multi-copper enzyme maturation permease subunit [Paeniclostridium ghonii]